jgi:hypothetical protein
MLYHPVSLPTGRIVKTGQNPSGKHSRTEYHLITQQKDRQQVTLLEAVKKSHSAGQPHSDPQGWVDWGSFRAEPLKLNYMAQLFVITLDS